jgi:hypothetical protein
MEMTSSIGTRLAPAELLKRDGAAPSASRTVARTRGNPMSTILLVILILLLLGALPAWPYSRSWGYRPSGLLTVLVVVLLVLLLSGRI